MAFAESTKALSLHEKQQLLNRYMDDFKQSLPENLEEIIKSHQVHNMTLIQSAQERAKIIKENNFLSGYNGYPLSEEQKSDPEELYDKTHTEIIIFVSSSMGIDAIREYIRDADKSGLINSKKVLLRGFVDGAKSVQPTINFLHRLIEDFEIQNVEIEIDPTIFRKYEVNTVPTFIIKETNPSVTPNHDDDSLSSAVAEYRLQGHIPLVKVFEILEKRTNESKYRKIQHEIRKSFFF